MNEKNTLLLSDIRDSEINIGIPNGNDPLKVIDTVRISALAMTEMSYKNAEMMRKYEASVASLRFNLSIEREKTNALQDQVNKITEQINDLLIKVLEQRSSHNLIIQQLKSSNADLVEKNMYLEDELVKAHGWLELIYTTAAFELKSTLEEIENINPLHLDKLKNNV